jgi:hypothetical protein
VLRTLIVSQLYGAREFKYPIDLIN